MHGNQLSLCQKDPARSMKLPVESLDARAGSLWHEIAGARNSSDLTWTSVESGDLILPLLYLLAGVSGEAGQEEECED